MAAETISSEDCAGVAPNPSISNTHVEVELEIDLLSLEDVLGSAFADYPIVSYIFQNITTRQERIRAIGWVLAYDADAAFSRSRVYRVAGSDKIAFVSVGQEPGSPPPNEVTFCGSICSSLAVFPFIYGISAMMRALEVEEYHNEWRAKLWSAEKHEFYLGLIGTHADFQGQGIGTQCMRSVLEIYKNDVPPGSEHVVTLITHTERNVRWYQKLGFKVVAEDMFQPEASGPGGTERGAIIARFMEQRFVGGSVAGVGEQNDEVASGLMEEGWSADDESPTQSSPPSSIASGNAAAQLLPVQ